MRTIGNILWLVLAGLWLAIGYAIAGVILCILIVTIPFGVQSFKLAAYSLWPFGRVVVTDPDATSVLGSVGNVVWFILAGWWLAAIHVITGITLMLTIIGFPLGLANFKLALLALVPFGKTVVWADSVGDRSVWMLGPDPLG